MAEITVTGLEDLLKRIQKIKVGIQYGCIDAVSDIQETIVDDSISNLRTNVGGPWPRPPGHKSILEKDSWVTPEPSLGSFGSVEGIVSCLPLHSKFVEFGTAGPITSDTPGKPMIFRWKDGSWVRPMTVAGQSPKHYFRDAVLQESQWYKFLKIGGERILQNILR